jgi:hypothetical protein
MIAHAPRTLPSIFQTRNRTGSIASKYKKVKQRLTLVVKASVPPNSSSMYSKSRNSGK